MPKMKMMKFSFQLLCTIVCLLGAAPYIQAEESPGHSLYKVTTYNLGTSVDFQDFSPVNSIRYKPLLITSTKADVLGADRFKDVTFGTSDERGSASGFAIAAEYSPLSRLAIQGVVGVTKNSWEANIPENKSSWEANLGVIYKMFGNLQYEMHFGYMDTGDLFKERNTYTDVESIIMISNQLTMSF